jgi:hypothetical protein
MPHLKAVTKYSYICFNLKTDVKPQGLVKNTKSQAWLDGTMPFFVVFSLDVDKKN